MSLNYSKVSSEEGKMGSLKDDRKFGGNRGKELQLLDDHR